MSKAEERALEAYPVKKEWVGNQYGAYGDINSNSRLKFQQGYEQAEKDLGWHSVDECLPKIDEEVIVLVDNIHGKAVEGANYICFGHIVDKNIAVDYNGWNIPGVKFWMPCPKIPNEE